MLDYYSKLFEFLAYRQKKLLLNAIHEESPRVKCDHLVGLLKQDVRYRLPSLFTRRKERKHDIPCRICKCNILCQESNSNSRKRVPSKIHRHASRTQCAVLHLYLPL